MKHIFIVNKISGKGAGLDSVSLIADICQRKQIEHEIFITQFPKHAKQIAQEYTEKDDVCLYAVGGDGTVLEVLNGLNKNVPMAIIPAGSGNDFYRLIKEADYDIEKIIEDTIDAEITKIDCAIANGMKFLNVTSIGIDSDVNFYASKLIRNTFITKGPAYILSIIHNVIIPRAKKMRVEIDGRVIEDEFLIATVMNGRYYGNGVPASPFADVQDGYLDVILARKCPVLTVYRCLVKYLSGKHLDDPHFEFIHAKHIRFEANEALSMQSDGENYMSKTLDIQVLEKSINFKAPKYLNIIK